MAKIEMIATQDFKAHKAGDSFQTSLKNSRDLIAQGVASLPGAPKKVATKKAPAKKAPAKKAAAKKTYTTRAMKAAK